MIPSSLTSIPVLATRLTPVSAAIGVTSSYHIDRKGDLYGGGQIVYNFNNEVTTMEEVILTPVQKIMPGVKFKKVMCDVWAEGGIALDKTGELWSWGQFYDQQYGPASSGFLYGDPLDKGTTWLTKRTTSNSLDYNLDLTRTKRWPPVRAFPGVKWKHVYPAEYYITYGVKEDGTLWSWGDDTNGASGRFRKNTSMKLDKFDLSNVDFSTVPLEDTAGISSSNYLVFAVPSSFYYGAESRGNIKTTLLKSGSGLDWEPVDLKDFDSNITQIYYVFYIENRWIASTNIGLMATTNGETWTLVHSTTSQYIKAFKIGTDVIIQGQFDLLVTNNFLTFTSRSYPSTGSSTDLAVLSNDLYYSIPAGPWWAPAGVTLWKSTDKGQSWSSIYTSTSNLFSKLYSVNGNLFAIAGVGKPSKFTLVTSTNGVTWNRITEFDFETIINITYHSQTNQYRIFGKSNTTSQYSVDYVDNWGSPTFDPYVPLYVASATSLSGPWTYTHINDERSYFITNIVETNEFYVGIESGRTTPSSTPIPGQIGTDTDWVYAEGFFWYGSGWKENGDLYVWGMNSARNSSLDYDTYPTGIDTTLYTPILLFNYPDFDKNNIKRKIAWTTNNSLVIKPDGTLWAYGEWHNENGYDSNIWGPNTYSGVQLSNRTDWDTINDMGDYYMLIAITKNGEAFAFGPDGYGVFWNLEKINIPEKVVYAGIPFIESAPKLLTEDGKLYSFGVEDRGEEIGDSIPADDNTNYYGYRTPSNPALIATDVATVHTNYWTAVLIKKTGEVYGIGFNDMESLGLPYDAEMYEIGFPMRLFNYENLLNTDPVSVIDRENIWKDYMYRYGNYYDGEWYWPPLTNWNWGGGPGWSSPPPVARYPSDVILRDQTVSWYDWNWEDGLVWMEPYVHWSGEPKTPWERFLVYSKLKEISYLALGFSDGDLENYITQVLKNVESIETLEVWTAEAGGTEQFDFSKFNKLDASKIKFMAIQDCEVANLPANFGSNVEGYPQMYAECVFDEISRETIKSIPIWELLSIDNRTNILISDLKDNAEIHYLELMNYDSTLNLSDLNTRKVRSLRISSNNILVTNQTMTLRAPLHALAISDSNFLSINITKSVSWADDSSNFIPDASTEKGIYIGYNSALTEVTIKGLHNNIIGNILITNNSVLSDLDIFDRPTTVLENIEIISCPSITTIKFLENISGLGGTINIPSSIASNPGFEKIPSTAWLAQPAQASKFVNNNQNILCNI